MKINIGHFLRLVSRMRLGRPSRDQRREFRRKQRLNQVACHTAVQRLEGRVLLTVIADGTELVDGGDAYIFSANLVLVNGSLTTGDFVVEADTIRLFGDFSLTTTPRLVDGIQYLGVFEFDATFHLGEFEDEGDFENDQLIVSPNASVVTESSGNSHFYGPITGSGSLVIGGTSPVFMAAEVASIYTGTTTVNGTLFIGHSASLGASGAEQNTIVTEEGELYLDEDNISVAEHLDLSGLLGVTETSAKWSGPIHISSSSVEFETEFQSDTLTISGPIGGSGEWQKMGEGILELTNGGNTFSGTSIIHDGAIFVSGVTHADNDFVVEEGAVLTGTGAINGAITVEEGGLLIPGKRFGVGPLQGKIGVLSTGDLTLEQESLLSVQISGASNAIAGTHYSQVNVTGTVSLSGMLNIVSKGKPSGPAELLLIKNDGFDPVQGSFAALPGGTMIDLDGEKRVVYYDGRDGNDVVMRWINRVPSFATGANQKVL